MGTSKIIIVLILLLINIAGFIMVRYDKRQALAHRWRVPESRFFILAFFGGGIGIYIGMQVFRHKTKHLLFTLGIPLMIILDLVSTYKILTRV